jgi:hypothetical protein
VASILDSGIAPKIVVVVVVAIVIDNDNDNREKVFIRRVVCLFLKRSLAGGGLDRRKHSVSQI